eukprot:TRINITY_DN197_c0_g1_i4.p1 TRINITY_DN197_c0_g1~~TRINITY_DN197_c0_g1_i4.p1  ORF type:complete len:620 (+),score=131.04 TRINITY_DN197_c0_g1_i4:142-1860(+)
MACDLSIEQLHGRQQCPKCGWPVFQHKTSHTLEMEMVEAEMKMVEAKAKAAKAAEREAEAKAKLVRAETDAVERRARVRVVAVSGPSSNKMPNTSTLAEIGHQIMLQFGGWRYDWYDRLLKHNGKSVQWPSDEWGFFTSSSCLTEAEVQKHVNKLLEKQPTVRSQYRDTHNACTCFGPKKPDLLLVESGKPSSPLTILAILELKLSDTSSYNSNANIGQIYGYARQLLHQLPEFRQQVMVGITDMKRITLVSVMRMTSGTLHHCTLSPEYTNVREVMTALMTTDPAFLVQAPYPIPAVNGEPLVLLECMGSGYSSQVFSCHFGANTAAVEHIEQTANAIVKCVVDNVSSPNDAQVMKMLQQGNCPHDKVLVCTQQRELTSRLFGWCSPGGVPNVPKLEAVCDDHVSVVMSPIATEFSSALIPWKLFNQSFLWLLNTLQAAHALPLVHRDVRPENIMLGPSEEVLLIDWGYAVAPGRRYYCGTLHFASDSVLQQLECGSGEVDFQPADDLVSLVRAFFVLLYPAEQSELCSIKDHEQIRQFWSDLRRTGSWLDVAHQAACQQDYTKLRALLPS